MKLGKLKCENFIRIKNKKEYCDFCPLRNLPVRNCCKSKYTFYELLEKYKDKYTLNEYNIIKNKLDYEYLEE